MNRFHKHSSKTTSNNWRYRRLHGLTGNRIYCWFAQTECWSIGISAGSFAVNAGLQGWIDVVIAGSKSC